MPPTCSSAVNSHQQLLVVCRVSSSLSKRSNVSHVFAGRTLILFAMARIDSPLPPMFLLCAGSVCPGAFLARPDPCSHRVSSDSTLRSFLRPQTKAPNTWRRPTRYQADGSVPFKRWGCSSFSVFMGRDAGKTRNASRSSFGTCVGRVGMCFEEARPKYPADDVWGSGSAVTVPLRITKLRCPENSRKGQALRSYLQRATCCFGCCSCGVCNDVCCFSAAT